MEKSSYGQNVIGKNCPDTTEGIALIKKVNGLLDRQDRS